ncbi:MAG: nucleoside 2-deoxyribosyltransferase [Thermoplasmata archaeon]|nr:MAG: nucleoside 2-deoxyribosyltransferase [Thermoplasmata archaeon]
MTQNQNLKIYLASPLGFTESTKEFMEGMVKILELKDFEVLNPWTFISDNEFKKAEEIKDIDKRREEFKKIDKKIAKDNEDAIRESDMLFAILDGTDVDSGTASEIGFAFGLGKKIYGYRGDFRQSGDNEGVIINLQVQHWIEESGGRIFFSINEIKEEL